MKSSMERAETILLKLDEYLTYRHRFHESRCTRGELTNVREELKTALALALNEVSARR
jgi:hypothetical protein